LMRSMRRRPASPDANTGLKDHRLRSRTPAMAIYLDSGARCAPLAQSRLMASTAGSLSTGGAPRRASTPRLSRSKPEARKVPEAMLPLARRSRGRPGSSAARPAGCRSSPAPFNPHRHRSNGPGILPSAGVRRHEFWPTNWPINSCFGR
jgi:hypothetical protein